MTFILMAIIMVTGICAFIKKTMFGALLMHPHTIVKHKEYFRIVAGDFVHVDLYHLLFNQAMMYIFCSNLEEVLIRRSIYGSWLLLIVFMGSMLIGNVITTYLNYQDFDYSSAGCSGSIMGCIFSFMLLDPHGHAINDAFIGEIENIYTGIFFILALYFYKSKKKNDAINYDLHFYGALGGIVTTVLLLPFLN